MYYFILKIFLLLTITSCTISHPSILISHKTKPPYISGSAYMLMDYNSKQILTSKNINLPVEPASLTKMMTVYVIDNEIAAGRIKLDDKVRISKKAWQAPGARMFLKFNSEVLLEDLLRGVIIQSGNDASIALAEHISGTEKDFAELMNAYAKILGMENTNFVNSSGLPQQNHLTTVQDLAKLAVAIIQKFPRTYKIYSEKSFKYNDILQQNRNRLLWSRDKYDGIKTGFTNNAGYCIVASRIKEGMRLIAIIMGIQNDHIRTQEAQQLLNWGFRFFETHLLYQASSKLRKIRIWMGSSKNIDVGFENDLYVTVPKGQYNFCNTKIYISNIITAPVKKGKIIGNYIINNLDGEVIKKEHIISLQNISRGNIVQYSRDFLIQKYNLLLNRIRLIRE